MKWFETRGSPDLACASKQAGYDGFVLKRFGQMLMVVAALAATGTHWTILQSFAWTTMLGRNLQITSLREAMVETFDGKHPCCLCKAIAAGKKSEKKSDFTVSLQRLEFVFPQTQFAFQAPQDFTLLPDILHHAWHALPNKPSVPPPRGLLG